MANDDEKLLQSIRGIVQEEVRGIVREEVPRAVAPLQDGIDQLAAITSRHFGEVYNRLDRLEGKVTSIDGRLEIVEKKVTSIDGRLEIVERKVTSIDGRLRGLERAS